MQQGDIDFSEEALLGRVVLDTGQARIGVEGLPQALVTASAAQLLAAIASAGILVDLVVQNAGSYGTGALTITLPADRRVEAVARMEQVLGTFQSGRITRAEPVAKLSVAGSGLKTHSGIAATLFEALATARVNIELIATSELVIAVVIGLADAERAFDIACEAFGFQDEGAGEPPVPLFTD